jgi:hypothetical protein
VEALHAGEDLMIVYNTLKTAEVMSDKQLSSYGKIGWILGGVVTVQISVKGVIVPRHYYHFWKKKE